MILAMTGHRAIGSVEAFDSAFFKLFTEHRPDAFIQGLADGADLRSAQIAINFKIPVISAMPWPTHYEQTKEPEAYRFVLDHSEEVYPVTEVESYPGPWVFFRRNEWMVDEADRVVAWWDGRRKGGTFGAIRYAVEESNPIRPVRNLHPSRARYGNW